MEAKRITPEPVSVPDVVTLTMSLEEANLLRNLMGFDVTIPQFIESKGLLRHTGSGRPVRPEDVSILMGSINAALWKAL